MYKACFLLLLFAVLSHSTVIIIEGTQSLFTQYPNGIKSPSLLRTEFQRWEEVEGYIVCGVDGDNFANVNVSGKIALIASPKAMFRPLDILKELQGRDAIAVLIVCMIPNSDAEGDPGIPSFQRELRDHPDLLPSASIDSVSGQMLFQACLTSPIKIKLSQEDHNLWWEALHGAIMWVPTTILTCAGFIVFIYAIKRELYLLSKHKKVIMAHVVVALEGANALITFLSGVCILANVDNIFIEPANQVLVSLNWPTSVGCVLLISFYWFEVLDGFITSTWLKKMKYPFIFFVVLMVAAEFVSIGLRLQGDLDRTILLTIQFLVYISILVVLTIFFFVQGVRMMLLLNNKSLTGEVYSRQKKATILLMMSGVLNLLFATVIICGLTPTFWNAYANTYLYFQAEMSIVLGGALRIASFSLPKKQSNQSKPSRESSQTQKSSKKHLQTTTACIVSVTDDDHRQHPSAAN